jgi:hypothetical protein
MITFGLTYTDIRHASSEIAAALGLNFAAHESSFRGGDYYRAEMQEGWIYVQSNLDVLDNTAFESEWPIEQILLILDGPIDDWKDVRKKVSLLESRHVARLLRTGL